MTTMTHRISAAATILLALAIVAVLWLRALGVPLAVGPLASSTPVAATPTPAEPSPPGSQPALDVFARIEEQVSDLRDLPPADIGPPDLISREELAVELQAVFDETWTDAQLADDNLTLRAMGLLTQEQDIRQLTEFLYAEQVLGFYDFQDRRMVVVTNAGLTPEAQITYAHEYTHAMQDAAFDIGQSREDQAEDDDAALARLALEEGDATLTMFQWGFQNLSPDQLAGIGATPLPDTTGVPQWMIRQLEFPYLAGATLVGELWASGGWDAVNAAYDDPPTSTEQVLHPAKYVDAEAPVEVPDPDLAARLGAGWRDVESSTVGEAMLRIWLEELGVQADDATIAAAGWGGDRLNVASGPDGAWALAWRIAFDTPGQATEFDDAYSVITAELPFTAAAETTAAAERLVLHASSGSVMDRLERALGG
jgi:hypothetical protein